MTRAVNLIDCRFLRFAIVGSSNFLLGMFLFQTAWMASAFLGSFRTPAAQIVAYTVGMFWSFFWSRSWVFRSAAERPAELGIEATRFATVQILCLLASIVLVTITVDVIRLGTILGWVTAMAPLVLLNFFATSRWVFSRHMKEAHDENCR